MQRVQEVLRLKYQSNLSNRQIERLGQASRSNVSDIVKRFKASGLSVEAALSMKPETLESHLYPSSPIDVGTAKPHPDWLQVHKELGRKGMTRLLLWQEYKERHPDGYGYSQFKAYYRRFLQTLNPSMRQVHLAGDALFVKKALQKEGIDLEFVVVDATEVAIQRPKKSNERTTRARSDDILSKAKS